jgi:chemotaxis protein MotB
MRFAAKAWLTGLALVLGGLLVTGCETPGQLRAKSRQSESMVQELKAQNYELERQVAALQARSNELQDQMGKMVERESELEKTKAKLEEQLKGTQVGVSIKEGRLVMTIPSKIFFDTGKATIKTDAKATLDKISDVLRTDFAGNVVGIEGHTDNVPIKRPETKKLFKTNWELSTARALAVLHYLVDEHKLPEDQFFASGYSKFKPVADNKTEEGKSQNRRVEIVIMPSPGETAD